MASEEVKPRDSTEIKDEECNNPDNFNDSEDDELNELLDNALKDFGTNGKKAEEKNVTGAFSKDGEKWQNEFAKFQEHIMKTLAEGENLGNDENGEEANFDLSSIDNDELLSTFAKSMDELTKDLKDVTNPLNEEQLKSLQEAMSMGEQNSTEDPAAALSNLLENMNEENSDSSSIFGIMPLMQNVLKNILSKDLLYAPLKDIVDKFPDWLAESKMTLDDKDFDRYEKQFVLMKKVCEEFESEAATDSEEVKSDRFERILNHMQQMQTLGQPPKELVENIDFFTNQKGLLDDMSPEKCSIM